MLNLNVQEHVERWNCHQIDSVGLNYITAWCNTWHHIECTFQLSLFKVSRETHRKHTSSKLHITSINWWKMYKSYTWIPTAPILSTSAAELARPSFHHIQVSDRMPLASERCGKFDFENLIFDKMTKHKTSERRHAARLPQKSLNLKLERLKNLNLNPLKSRDLGLKFNFFSKVASELLTNIVIRRMLEHTKNV